MPQMPFPEVTGMNLDGSSVSKTALTDIHKSQCPNVSIVMNTQLS